MTVTAATAPGASRYDRLFSPRKLLVLAASLTRALEGLVSIFAGWSTL